MGSHPGKRDIGPFVASQLRSGDPYELSHGHPIRCAPTGGGATGPKALGAAVVGWDPAVKEVGIDTGYSPNPGTLRAPDIAVGNVPDNPGWVQGAPQLAIEYADIGQDEDTLQGKIADLLDAGTQILWVVRLTGRRLVEVHRPGEAMQTALPGEHLTAPGILKNPILVEALYDRKAAEHTTLTNLLERAGHADLAAALRKDWEEGRKAGWLVQARATLRRVLAKRKLSISPEIAARIEGCDDLARLDDWLDRAIDAVTLADVFGAD